MQLALLKVSSAAVHGQLASIQTFISGGHARGA